MITASQAAVAAYVHAMMQAFDPASPPGRRLTFWLRSNQCMVGLDFEAATTARTPKGRKRKSPAWDKPLPQRLWARLRAAIARSASAGATAADAVSANLDAFVRAVGLDPLEAEIFRFVFHTDRDATFERLCNGIVETRAIDTLSLTALCLGRKPTEIWDKLLRGPLKGLHLVDIASSGTDRFTYYVPYRIVAALMPPNESVADMERALIGEPLPPQLDLAAYDHVAQERDFVLRLLRGAEGRMGINILLYGGPGTGKSEFCKMVARAVGRDLFAVGETDESGEEPSRSDRLDALRLADKLAARRGKALLLFDEMEDILQRGERASSGRGPVRRAGSKVFFNRLLEQNQVPVLWTANAIDEFDPAFLRRMTFAFEMKALPAAGRARLWEAAARRQGLRMQAEDADVLARLHKVSPGLMTGAVHAVAMAGGGSDELDFVVKSLAHPLSGRRSNRIATHGRFQADLANTDPDLRHLQRALAAPGGARDFSLCLSGPPGTGKSAFARALAAAMGLEPLLTRGSDLLSMWVGETEQRLAEAFEEARQDDAFLIIDEVETFLWSRSGASRSWEVSIVNELLVQMETHPLPFACTTNHLDCIDPAALRRFTLKVKFDFMTPVQSAAAYRQFFGCEPPAALRSIEHLTPGDFAVVAKKLRLLGQPGDEAPDIVRLLEQEVAAKNLRTVKIGF
ncbi:AAA family ATPase [Dongia deserti]|uniref:AAA family ATPase n=1 Tax=Dongia deserti TaxID=2268030 RepID=UPI000E657F59|nr:AAA family ATPase [Dongia deserti]